MFMTNHFSRSSLFNVLPYLKLLMFKFCALNHIIKDIKNLALAEHVRKLQYCAALVALCSSLTDKAFAKFVHPKLSKT